MDFATFIMTTPPKNLSEVVFIAVLFVNISYIVILIGLVVLFSQPIHALTLAYAFEFTLAFAFAFAFAYPLAFTSSLCLSLCLCLIHSLYLSPFIFAFAGAFTVALLFAIPFNIAFTPAFAFISPLPFLNNCLYLLPIPVSLPLPFT